MEQIDKAKGLRTILRRDLFIDAQALFREQQPHTIEQGATASQWWDIEGFTSWPQLHNLSQAPLLPFTHPSLTELPELPRHGVDD